MVLIVISNGNRILDTGRFEQKSLHYNAMKPYFAGNAKASGRHCKIISPVLVLFIFKIETVKLDFKEKAKPKIGSKDLIDHKAGGGDKKV